MKCSIFSFVSNISSDGDSNKLVSNLYWKIFWFSEKNEFP